MIKVGIILLTMILLALVIPTVEAGAGNGLHIIVTFPGLVYDLKNIVCGNDVVESLIPPGVDPHEYSLTTGDVEKLQAADLIVSTGHTGFELKIEELWRNGVIRGVLVNILEIPGIIVKENPMTRQPVYHMPIYDPLNYIVFVRNVSETLASLNPSEAKCYYEKASSVASRIASLYVSTPRLGSYAIGDLPYTVYVADWLGLNLVGLIVKEEGLPATPEDIARFQNMLSNGTVKYLLVTAYGSDNPAASSLLEEWSKTYNVKVIKLYSETYPNSIPDKLEYIYQQLLNITIRPQPLSSTSPSTGIGNNVGMGLIIIVLALVVLSATVAYYILWGRRR
ncbi:metal ABC transporter substrate-binding protein [Thermogladius sp. 4427co]|uniref:metal ABC transporter substrate-binding protein n=1 Tax=Thermogladius sp. 4427co TaxID=3450718 RepID=UPI003F798E10